MAFKFKIVKPEWSLEKSGVVRTKEELDRLCFMHEVQAPTECEEVNWTDYVLSQLPEEFRSAVAYEAYERGHAYGESEVSLYVENMVDMLLPCIEQFKQRIVRDCRGY